MVKQERALYDCLYNKVIVLKHIFLEQHVSIHSNILKLYKKTAIDIFDQ
jgi:hypothetical protein